jgi:hypothetical protein
LHKTHSYCCTVCSSTLLNAVSISAISRSLISHQSIGSRISLTKIQPSNTWNAPWSSLCIVFAHHSPCSATCITVRTDNRRHNAPRQSVLVVAHKPCELQQLFCATTQKQCLCNRIYSYRLLFHRQLCSPQIDNRRRCTS